jgi:phosphatidylglycerol---prolipoprotein diacylglyceryl transferase
MFPVLFNIGPLTIHTYGVFVAMGFFAGLGLTIRLARTEGIPPGLIMDMSFVILVAAIIGSRALYVFMNLSFYLENPIDAFKLWEGGLVFSGGLAASAAVMGWYIHRHGLSWWKTGDMWAPGIALGQAVGRIGCLMAGCCYGKPAYDLPWALIFTDPLCLAPTGIPLHPTQLYSMISGFVIFGFLLALFYKKRFDGQVLIWFIILHSTARLIIERFRGDYRGVVFDSSMSLTQLVTLLLLSAGVAALIFKKNRPGKEQK